MNKTNDFNSSSRDTVGIAVVCWNNEAILPQCLDSVRKQTYKSTRTIVLDNNSADKSVKLIETKYPWVELIKSSTNTGFARGNNIIIRELMKDTDVRYVVLLNSDAALDSHWIEQLVAFAESKEQVAFLQGLTLDYYNHAIIDSTHVYINQKGQAIQNGHRQLVAGAKLEPMKVFGVNAAACMITRQYLKNQPFDYLFDEDFFMYLEDVDAIARAVVMGWSSYFVPEARAYHMGSASSGKNPGFSVYLVNRNRIPMLIKNLPVTILLRLLPRMIVGDAQELYRITRGKNYLVMRKFVSGRLKGVFTIPKYLKKARVVSKARKIDSASLWKLMRNGTEEI